MGLLLKFDNPILPFLKKNEKIPLIFLARTLYGKQRLFQTYSPFKIPRTLFFACAFFLNLKGYIFFFSVIDTFSYRPFNVHKIYLALDYLRRFFLPEFKSPFFPFSSFPLFFNSFVRIIGIFAGLS